MEEFSSKDENSILTKEEQRAESFNELDTEDNKNLEENTNDTESVEAPKGESRYGESNGDQG